MLKRVRHASHGIEHSVGSFGSVTTTRYSRGCTSKAVKVDSLSSITPSHHSIFLYVSLSFFLHTSAASPDDGNDGQARKNEHASSSRSTDSSRAREGPGPVLAEQFLALLARE